MIIGMVSIGQATPKLLKVYCKPAGEDTTFLKYQFDYGDEGNLKSVMLTDSMTSIWIFYNYVDDTLKHTWHTGGGDEYQHLPSDNMINEIHSDGGHTTYYTNNDYQVLYYQDTSYNSFDLNWQSKNLEFIYRNDTLMWHILTLDYLINPYYYMFRTFKINRWASYDLPVSRNLQCTHFGK